MKLPFKDDNVIENYGNNGIYGRFSNSAEAFGFLATLHSSPFATLRSGHITSGYGATGVAPPSPKFASQTSHNPDVGSNMKPGFCVNNLSQKERRPAMPSLLMISSG